MVSNTVTDLAHKEMEIRQTGLFDIKTKSTHNDYKEQDYDHGLVLAWLGVYSVFFLNCNDRITQRQAEHRTQ